MKLAIDTNRYSDLCRGIASVLEVLELAEEIAVPFIVIAELRAGFAAGRRQSENERTLRRFLAQPGVRVLYAEDQTTQQYANLFAQLRRSGTPIPTNDLWIAALTLQHGLVLYHRDRHFEHIPQLPVLTD